MLPQDILEIYQKAGRSRYENIYVLMVCFSGFVIFITLLVCVNVIPPVLISTMGRVLTSCVKRKLWQEQTRSSELALLLVKRLGEL